MISSVFKIFLGHAPRWYKRTLLAFLIINPFAFWAAGPFSTGWLILFEFIFTLALALKCYPLQPGGLIAIEAVVLGLASPDAVYRETLSNFSVIILLMFMVAGIYFIRDLLAYMFAKMFIAIEHKALLSLLFCASAAVLSAFLDALTVIAVVITVLLGLLEVYRKALSHGASRSEVDGEPPDHAEFLEFKNFLRSVAMHAAIGTALGGVCTLVGEPQNLLIGNVAGWDFMTFFTKAAPVSMPVLAVGLLTCWATEQFGVFGYGGRMPASVRKVLAVHQQEQDRSRDRSARIRLVAQGLIALALIAALAFHLAEVGLIGLAVIIVATAFCGVIDEKKIGHAFEEALPFTALLVTFFAIVAVIHAQHLFAPIVDLVLAQGGRSQVSLMFLANGLLSSISDNVFVATVYIGAMQNALEAGRISAEQFEHLAIAINTGTNIPSIATPNGQAAFLFLLTSSLAPAIQLGYLRMLWMALPYTVTTTVTGFAAVFFFL